MDVGQVGGMDRGKGIWNFWNGGVCTNEEVGLEIGVTIPFTNYSYFKGRKSCGKKTFWELSQEQSCNFHYFFFLSKFVFRHIAACNSCHFWPFWEKCFFLSYFSSKIKISPFKVWQRPCFALSIFHYWMPKFLDKKIYVKYICCTSMFKGFNSYFILMDDNYC